MFIILCLALRCNYAARLPASPCPNVFAYEGEPESDRWYGVITFSSNIELVGLNYKVQLDRPAQLLVSWDGEVRSFDNIAYSVFDPFHTQRAGEIVKARIMVKYNRNTVAPGISKIIINGNTLCSVNEIGSETGIEFGTGTTSTTRIDPTFNGEEIITPSYSSNRGNGPTRNQNTYNQGNSNGNGRPDLPNQPNYGTNSNVPNYNQNVGSSNQNVPNYNGNSNGPSYGSNGNGNFGNNPTSNSNNYPGSGSNGPNYGSSSNNNNPNYVNPTYAGGSDNVNYPNQQQGSGSFGNSQSSWPETQQAGSNSNRNTSWNSGQNGYVNPQSNTVDSNVNQGPVVTTLALPNGIQNKTNIDQLVQNIKNQLEQQQINTNSNKTVIVAVVYPTNSLAYSSSTAGHHTTESSTTHRPTTSTPVASNIKVKTVTPVKQNNQRNKD